MSAPDSLIAFADLRARAAASRVAEARPKVTADELDALIEVAELASELTLYLGNTGAPDLRNRVAKLDVALAVLGG